jgi:CelD/BcsL family acetyltransferase involved in cellulose biosynthesis
MKSSDQVADGVRTEPPGSRAAPIVRKVPFNFRLGEWNLFSLSRPLEVLEARGGAPPPDWKPDATRADGFLLNGVYAPVDPRLMAPRAGWAIRIFREYPRYYVDLTTGFDAYLGKFSGKTRSTFKRKLRKFHELSGGTALWKRYQTKVEMAEFLPLARELSAKTYQERLLAAGLPAGAAFVADAMARAEQGRVRGYLLFLNGRPVSYLYLPVEGTRAIYRYLGYDPACAEHSPGTVLQLLALESMFAEPGLSVFDFTEGEGQHKQLFATHSENCADLLFTKRFTLTNFVAAVHAGFVRAKFWMIGLLDRLGVKARVKRLLRGTRTTPPDT